MKSTQMISNIVKPIKTCFAISMLLATLSTSAQVLVADTDTEPDEKAILDVNSNSKGFLWPRLTTAAIEAIANPTEGLVVYNDEEKSFLGWNGTKWVNLGLDTTPVNTNPNISQFSPGDFAFTAIIASNPDAFSLLPLKDVPAGQIFYVTDCGIKSDGESFRLHEGAIKWEVTTAIPARTEITFSKSSAQGQWSANEGTVTHVVNNGNYDASFNPDGLGLVESGDQIILFTASAEVDPMINVDKFITALSLENSWKTTGQTNNSHESYIPNGLIPDINAVTLDVNGDNKDIICTPTLQTMSIDELRIYLNNVNDWTHTDTRGDANAPSGCTF